MIDALPATTTIDCPAAPIFAVATATDNCGSAFTLTYFDVTTPGACAGSYSITRTWTATDDCGNSSTASQTINVQDITAPVIDALPATTTIDCPAAPIFAVATATDNCGSAFTLTYFDVTTPGACAGSYSITRTWTATDDCGNSSTASQTINVQDITAPVIDALPAVSTIDCPAVPAFAVATATDNCGSAFTLTSTDVTTPGACSGSYSITRTWTATDDCGNSSTASQTINVQDITAPVIDALPAVSTIDCPAVPAFAIATATDNCGSAFTLTSTDLTTAGACAGSYSITRTWTATDDCGNSSTASQTINVQDITAPVIDALPAVSTIDCPAVPAFAIATATDNCGSAFTLTSTDVTTPGACSGSYSITRTWTATDDCGNSSTASQTINVQDITAPAIICPASIVVQTDPSLNTAAVTVGQPIVSDDCGTVTFTNDYNNTNNASGIYNLGVTSITWTATDECGNTATCQMTVTVADNEGPTMNCPPTISVNCIEEVPAAYTTLVEFIAAGGVADDNSGIDAATFMLVSQVSDNLSCPETISRVYSIADISGNVSTCTQIAIVHDIISPVIAALPSVTTIDCPATPLFAVATATDNCTIALTLTFNDITTAGTCAGSYSVTRTWTATDACGNSSTSSQTINVQDITAPVITTIASDLTVECDGAGNIAELNAWLAANGGAVASDICSGICDLQPSATSVVLPDRLWWHLPLPMTVEILLPLRQLSLLKILPLLISQPWLRI